MTEPITITVRWDAAKTSPNALRRLEKTAPAGARRLRREAKTRALEAWHNAGHPVLDGKAVLDVTLRRARKLDADNALAACKGIIDSLCTRKLTGKGLLADDGPDYLEIGTITQVTAASYKDAEQVELTFRPHQEDTP